VEPFFRLASAFLGPRELAASISSLKLGWQGAFSLPSAHSQARIFIHLDPLALFTNRQFAPFSPSEINEVQFGPEPSEPNGSLSDPFEPPELRPLVSS